MTPLLSLPTRLAASVALALSAAACSGPSAAGPDANVVFLSRADCSVFVAKTYQGGFAVLESRSADYTPRPADLLEGDLRGGTLTLRYVADRALRQGEDTTPVEVRVLAASLPVEDAQAQYRSACPALETDPALPPVLGDGSALPTDLP